MAKIKRLARYAKSAHLIQTVLFYDGPQIILARSDRGFFMVGVAVDIEDIDYPIYFTEVTDKDYYRYLREKVDLRFLFTEASKRKYVADWDQIDNKRLDLWRFRDEFDDEDLIPLSGFWSRNHNVALNEELVSANAIAEFAIDGAWDAPDFARLYAQFSDIYAFVAISSRKFRESLSSASRTALETAVRHLEWKGGGSYLSYYENIFSKVSEAIPLGVREISYASPGRIRLKGDKDALEEVLLVVNNFAQDADKVVESARNLDQILSKFNLKRQGIADAKFPTQEIEIRGVQLATDIFSGLGIDDPEVIKANCQQNSVMYAKVSLSFYRRAKRLYAFHAEGRVRGTNVTSVQD